MKSICFIHFKPVVGCNLHFRHVLLGDTSSELESNTSLPLRPGLALLL